MTFREYAEKRLIDYNLSHDRLYLQCKGLTDIDGIQDYPNLKHLVISHNQISSLKGLEYCTKLRSLRADDNFIECLDEIQILKNLRYVNLRNNPITHHAVYHAIKGTDIPDRVKEKYKALVFQSKIDKLLP